MVATKGFVEQNGRDLIAKELHVQSHNILLWRVYTEADFTLRKTQKNSRRPVNKKQG